MADLTPPPSQSGAPAPQSPPGGGQIATAPAVSNGATEMVKLVQTIVQSSRAIAQKVPSTGPIVRKINDLVQDLQRAIVSNQPPTEPAAPPV